MLNMFLKNFLQVLCVSLQRTDEPQLRLRRYICFAKKLRELSRDMDMGQPIPTALLGRFDGNVLPFALLLRGLSPRRDGQWFDRK